MIWIKIKLLPFMKYNLLKHSPSLFPKTPCTVVNIFLWLINNKNLFVPEERMKHHSVQEAKSCATGAGDDIIKVSVQINWVKNGTYKWVTQRSSIAALQLVTKYSSSSLHRVLFYPNIFLQRRAFQNFLRLLFSNVCDAFYVPNELFLHNDCRFAKTI